MAELMRGAMPTAPWQRAGLAGMALACMALKLPGRDWQLAICVPAIAVFGLPHGATDWALARILWRPAHGRSWPMRFALFYAALMACVAASAWAWPALTLAGFVAVAAWHFGTEDIEALGLRRGWAECLACGALPVCGPALFWPDQTRVLVGLLGVPVPLSAIRGLGAAALLVWAIAAARAVLRAGPAGRRLAADLGLAVSLQVAAPPLLSFATFFCVLHGPRHLAALPPGVADWQMLPVSLLAVAIIGCAVLLAPSHAAAGLGWAGANGLFWGLACLTLPHLVLGHIANHQRTTPSFLPEVIS